MNFITSEGKGIPEFWMPLLKKHGFSITPAGYAVGFESEFNARLQVSNYKQSPHVIVISSVFLTERGEQQGTHIFARSDLERSEFEFDLLAALRNEISTIWDQFIWVKQSW